MTTDLFTHEVEGIPGLFLVEDFITKEEETTLMTNINDPTEMPWNTSLKRRTKHYGGLYNYKSKSLSHQSGSASAEAIPAWCDAILDKLAQFNFDQLIINEYVPGQGISAHTDHIRDFGPVIASLSLNSACVMKFSHVEFKDVWLPRRSLVILTEDARYKWKHEIVARKSDINTQGIRVKRDTRVSLTFRTKK